MLEQHGAVSEEVAIAMATGACEKFGADYGLSVTGLRALLEELNCFRLVRFTWDMLLPLESGQNNSICVGTVHPIAGEQPPPLWTGCVGSFGSIKLKKSLPQQTLEVLKCKSLLSSM